MKGKKSKAMGKVTHAVAKGGSGDGIHNLKKNRTYMASGSKPAVRLDKRARGGKVMTPSSPLSGAEPKGSVGKVGTDKDNN